MQTECKITWDEASYRQVQGPKAVSIKAYIEEPVTMLRYCAASERTLAISHVWIHGQGGRPETGINQCLHQRYARIAKNNDCDSYWMDTTCILTDHDLRREAISHINKVFNRCAAALICDRDIMQLDVSQMTMVRQEEALATLLLSDWNVRAWTLLESVKARGKILLLCKDDLVVYLDELMQNVCNHGRLDMAIFSHQLPHMLPLNPKYTRAIHETSIEIVASWLSCRPASRENDAVTIWSLLVLDEDKDPAYDAIDFWKSRVDSSMRTGFLLTSAPRLKIKGLRWAPSTPYAPPRQELTGPEAQMYRSLPGHKTGVVVIRKNGIWGQWDKFCFDLCLRDFCRLSWITCPTKRELAKIRRTYLRGYRYGALLRPIELKVEIEYSKTSEYFTPRIDGQGMLLVICGSNMRHTGLEPGGIAAVLKHQQPSVRWAWLAVYEWPIENVPLPEPWVRDLKFWIS